MGLNRADELEKYACDFLTLDYYGIKKTGVFAACDVNINTGQVTTAVDMGVLADRKKKKRKFDLIFSRPAILRTVLALLSHARLKNDTCIRQRK